MSLRAIAARAAVIIGLAGLMVISVLTTGILPELGREVGGGIKALRVITSARTYSTLERQSGGRNEILVLSPGCPACVSHMVAETAKLDQVSEAERRIWEQRVLVVARDQGPPPKELARAFERAESAGAKIVYAKTSEIFRKLDFRQFPALLRRTPEGWRRDPTFRNITSGDHED